MCPEPEPSSETPDLEYLKAAFLAMEPTNCFLSLARQCGGGSITEEVQTFILENCVGNGVACNNTYVKSVLKKVIVAAESTRDGVVEGLYEQFAYCMTLHTEDGLLRKDNKIYKQISFLCPNGYDDVSSGARILVSLQCSLNMLEGDTGCAIWPSSLFLSEYIFSHPTVFSNKVCFEVGSGVGLVGISLAHIGASKLFFRSSRGVYVVRIAAKHINLRRMILRNVTKDGAPQPARMIISARE